MPPNSLNIAEIVSAEMASRVKELMLFSRYRVQGLFPGDNKSTRKGFSSDFMQHREYFPGDNLKYLDWRVYARTERFVVREFEENTNLDMYLVLDNSASMSFGGSLETKHAFAVKVAGVLLYLMLLQNDHFGLSLVSEALVAHTDPGGSRRHLRRVYEMLLAHEPAGVCDWLGALRLAQTRAKRRGLVIVLSDFMGEPEPIGKGLASFRSRGSDVIGFHLIHPEERELPQMNMTRFVDIEDGTVETVDPLTIRQAYQRQFEGHRKELRDEFTRRGVAYHSLIVGEDYEKAVGDYLRKREAMLL